MKDMSALEQAMGVAFRDKALLRQALTHSSLINEGPSSEAREHNERLEFLGDAVLSSLVAEAAYLRHPDMPEGQLTEMRSALVCRGHLAEVAWHLELGSYLSLGRGEELGGGRERDSNLAGALEAVIGAAYLDGGYERARAVVNNTVLCRMEVVMQEGVPRDPKSRLQERLQREGKPPPVYTVTDVAGPEHKRQFTVEVRVDAEVLGKGQGSSKSEAERAAARNSLICLEAKDSVRSSG